MINKKLMKKIRIVLIILLLIISTGCTKTLKDSNKNPVKNKLTGQNLTKNILCQPTDKKTIELYKKNKVEINKLPKCSEFKATTGKYEGLWTSIFIKPLAFILLWLGKIVKNNGISLIIVSLIIRLIAYPITKKTALQSEQMKKAQPEIKKIQNKYKDKQDQESMMKQSQEMMMLYKKYNINPISGCLVSFIQLPIFIAFYEAVQRFPAIFEDSFLTIQLGTTPFVGFGRSNLYVYIILMILIAVTTFYSFKMSMSGEQVDPSMKHMPIFMSIMIIVTALFMPSALCIYWFFNNLFTIIQNKIVRKSMKNGNKTLKGSKKSYGKV